MRTLLVIAAMLLAIPSFAQNALTLGTKGERHAIPAEQHVYLSESSATFKRAPDTWVWIGDAEHVIEKSQKKMIFLADKEPAYTLTDDIVPANKDFELFPYHYYDKWEEEQLGARINFRLFIENRGDKPIDVDLKGIGTTNDWDHGVAWAAALKGQGARKLTLAPGDAVTLWEEKRLAGGLPWSAIILGRATGDLRVVDYAWIGDTDPGVSKAEQLPDLAWPPYNLASFTRGTANWNEASIDLFTDRRIEAHVPVTSLADRAHSIVFGYSEGGPPINPCVYKAVQPTFAQDVLMVKDPISGYSHVFLGGNYPIMYRFHLPVANDTAKPQVVRFDLASNDQFKVNSFAGVFIDGQFVSDQVIAIGRNEHWTAFARTLQPGENAELEWTVVALGGKWGGLIGTIACQPANN